MICRWILATLCVCTTLSAGVEYRPKDYKQLLGEVPGIDDEVLKMHIKLYEGYVKATNQLSASLDTLIVQGKSRSQEYAGLKRMFGWEFDGMRLHEYYFDALRDVPVKKEMEVYEALAEEFGSFEKWKQDFIDTGLMRGIGWVVLYYDVKTKQLINAWINEHDLGHLAGATPLLVMDVFEHAYITQYGLDRKGYIEAFFDNINWDLVNKRFQGEKQAESWLFGHKG